MNTLSRKTVFDIQRDVRMNILQPFKDVDTTMEATRAIPSQGCTIFKKCSDIFVGVETENKLIEKSRFVRQS